MHVTCLVGLGEPLHQRPLPRRTGRRRFPVGRPCAPVLQGGPGALEGAGHRLLGAVQDARGLARPESQDVPQDQHGALPWRQQLQGGDEGHRDRLGGLIPGLGAGRGVGEPLEQHVGVGLQPGHLAEPGGLGQLNPGRRPVHRRSPARRAQRVQAAPGGDLVQPDTHRGAALEPGQALPGRQQGLLQRVLRVEGRAEDPVAVHLQLAPVGADELAERLLVAGPGPVYQVRAHRTTLP